MPSIRALALVFALLFSFAANASVPYGYLGYSTQMTLIEESGYEYVDSEGRLGAVTTSWGTTRYNAVTLDQQEAFDFADLAFYVEPYTNNTYPDGLSQAFAAARAGNAQLGVSAQLFQDISGLPVGLGGYPPPLEEGETREFEYLSLRSIARYNDSFTVEGDVDELRFDFHVHGMFAHIEGEAYFNVSEGSNNQNVRIETSSPLAMGDYIFGRSFSSVSSGGDKSVDRILSIFLGVDQVSQATNFSLSVTANVNHHGAADFWNTVDLISVTALNDGFEVLNANVIGAIAGDMSSYMGTEVPVPAAAWLLGSGLLGLIGVARKRRT